MGQNGCASNPTRAVSSSTLSEYKTIGNANWKFQNNLVSADSGSGFLVSTGVLSDFHLKVEFLAGAGTNSGIFFRCSDQNLINDQTCYEANIFDTRPDQAFRTGAITGLARPKVIINSEDQKWHTYELFVQGDQIKVIIDQKETVFTRDQKNSSGFIAFQLAQGEIQFRNLKVVNLQTQSEPKTSALDGVWELQSMSTIDKAGNIKPWCEGAFGVIMYVNGYMSTAVNCTTDPAKAVLYSGPFHIENQTVYHHAQNFSQPSLNKIHVRNFYLADQNHLELSGDLGESKVVVKWVRR